MASQKPYPKPGSITTAGHHINPIDATEDGEYEYEGDGYEDDECECVETCLGGRADTGHISGTRSVQTHHFYGNPADVAFAPGVNPPLMNGEAVEQKASQRSGDDKPRLWLLRSTVDEVHALGPGNYASPVNQMAYDGLAGTPNWSGRSIDRVLVRFGSAGRGDEFLMDAGSSPIELYATDVEMVVITPQAVQEVINFPNALAGGGGGNADRVENSIGLEIIPIENARGRTSTTLTHYIAQTANTFVGVQIPRYARRVAIYQDPTLGIPSVQWSFRIGSLQASWAAGNVPFMVGQLRSEPIDIVPSASFIQADVDVLNNRNFLVVFEIEGF